MGSKQKKRKAHKDAESITHSADGPFHPEQGENGSTVTTVGEQGILLAGAAKLTVLSGAIEVSGARLAPESAPVELIADAEIGGPLHIIADAVGEQVRVPLAAGTTTVSLEAPPGTVQMYEPGDPQAATPQPVPAIWRSVAQTITEAAGPSGRDGPLRVAVCGSKGVGKSTFARLLVNKLLNTHPCVAYLDTDCGQPEFTVPGVVSLVMVTTPIFGPPHLHHRRPHRCHFVGDLSPQMDPVQYVLAVKALYRWYCQEAGKADAWPPLVINTHGWIQGIGLDVMSLVLQATSPTHVLTLQTANPKRNLPEGRFWFVEEAPGPASTHLLVIPGLSSASMLAPAQMPLSSGGPEPSSDRQLTAPELRGLAWLTFALRCLGQYGGKTIRADPETYTAVASALAACPPYEVACSDVKVQVQHMAVPRKYLAHVINCTVVGLAASQPSKQPSDPDDPLECVGLGFVRSVDAAKGVLYVLTDADPEALQRVNVLQVGKLEIPPALLQTRELMSPYLSLWSINADGSGAGQIRSRNNLIRSGQL